MLNDVQMFLMDAEQRAPEEWQKLLRSSTNVAVSEEYATAVKSPNALYYLHFPSIEIKKNLLNIDVALAILLLPNN
jgi:hypothetical protein